MDLLSVCNTLAMLPTPEALTIAEFRIEYLEYIADPVCRVLVTLGDDRIFLKPMTCCVINPLEEIITTHEAYDCQLRIADALVEHGLYAAIEVIEEEAHSPRYVSDPTVWIPVV